MPEATIKFADLFAGLGGFHLAAEELGCECVFASEISEPLRDLYENNFGMRPHGDIRAVDIESIPTHDLLCAGFPCQPFSKAGGQLGTEDEERGNFFGTILNILEAISPRFVLLENVAHFVKHDSGNTYNAIKQGLIDLDYDVRTGTLSPHQFGIPQIRERMYLVARKGRSSLSAFSFPTPYNTDLSLSSILEPRPRHALSISQPIEDCLNLWQEFLDHMQDDAQIPNVPIWSMEFGATYPYEVDSLSCVPLAKLRSYKGAFGTPLDFFFRKDLLLSLPSHARSAEATFPTWKRNFIRQNRAFYRENKVWLNKWRMKIKKFPSSLQKLEWNCKGEARTIWNKVIQLRASGVRVKRPTTSPSIVAMTSTQIPIIGWEKRYMTARELARLQSLESLRQLPSGEFATRSFGNAVNVTVAKLVLDELLNTDSMLTVAA